MIKWSPDWLITWSPIDLSISELLGDILTKARVEFEHIRSGTAQKQSTFRPADQRVAPDTRTRRAELGV